MRQVRFKRLFSDLTLRVGVALLFLSVSAACTRVTDLQTTLSSSQLSLGAISLPPGVRDQFYSSVVTATGGKPAYAFALAGGSLPPGLSLASLTGVISGTVGSSATGTYSFSVQLTDADGASTTRSYSIRISSAVVITTASLTASVINTAYTMQIAATGGVGGSYSFSAVGLPPGLSIGVSGLISGAATVAGTYSVQLIATDSEGLQGSKTLDLAVSAPLSITTSTLPNGYVGQSYSATVTASNGTAPYSFRVSAGSLPAGLSINSSTGAISGFPDAGANVVAATISFTVEVADAAAQTATRSFNVRVTIPPRVIDDLHEPLRVAGLGVNYSELVDTSGGVGRLCFTATGLPSGLGINATSGRITGAATQSGTFSVAIQVRDSSGAGGANCSGPLQVAVNKSLVVRTAGSAAPRPSGTLGGTLGTDTLDFNPGLETRNIRQIKGRFRFSASQATDELAGIFRATNANQQRPYVMTTTGNGVYTTSLGALLSTSPLQQPWAIVGARITTDALDDLLVAVSDNGSNHSLLFYSSETTANGGTNNFASGFSPTVSIPLPSRPLGMTWATLNGVRSLVYTNWDGNAVRVVHFCESAPGVPSATLPVNVSGATAGTACTAAGTGASTIQYLVNPTALATTASNPIGVAVRDVVRNPSFPAEDSAPDLIVTNWSSNNIQIFRGRTDGTFAAGGNPIPGVGSGAINAPNSIDVSRDFNGDGVNDIVTAWAGNSALMIHFWDRASDIWNTSLTQTLTPVQTDIGAWVQEFDTGDIDGDGDIDIVFNQSRARHTNGVFATGNLYAFYNTTTGFGSPSASVSFVRREHRTSSGAINIALTDAPVRSLYPEALFGAVTPLPSIVTTGVWSWPLRYQIHPNLYRPASNFASFEPSELLFSQSPFTWSTGFGRPVTADLNGDGRVDVLSKLGASVSVNMANADGTYSIQANTPPAGDNGTNWWFGRQLIRGDFNGDGRWDYASGNWNAGAGGTVTVALGTGDGGFSSQITFAANNDCAGTGSNMGIRSLDTADFNLDGKLDLAVGTGCSISPESRTNIFFGRGDGTFENNWSAAALRPVRLEGQSGNAIDYVRAFDMNGDGLPDIVMVNNSRRLQLFLNQSAQPGTFPSATVAGQTQVDVVQVGNVNIGGMDIGDLNLDGCPDVVLSSVSGASSALVYGAGASCELLNGSPLLLAGGMSEAFFNNRITADVLLTDWNLDGRLDLLLMKAWGISLYLNATVAGGAATFASTVPGYSMQMGFERNADDTSRAQCSLARLPAAGTGVTETNPSLVCTGGAWNMGPQFLRNRSQ
jgi:hypothetical protein